MRARMASTCAWDLSFAGYSSSSSSLAMIFFNFSMRANMTGSYGSGGVRVRARREEVGFEVDWDLGGRAMLDVLAGGRARPRHTAALYTAHTSRSDAVPRRGRVCAGVKVVAISVGIPASDGTRS